MLAALLLLAASASRTDLPLPDGNALVQELAGKQRHWEEVINDYTYDVVVVREDLDKDGKVTKREVRGFEVFYVKARPIRRLVSEDGRPLPPDRQAKIDREVREKVEDIKAGRAANERSRVALSTILERYDFRAVKRETLDSGPAIVLEFTPRPGSRPLDHDNVLRILAGQMWVDETEREVVRAEIRNTGGLKVLGGVGASVSDVSAVLEFRRVADALWLPVRDETQASGRVMLFKSFRTRIVRTYDNFRRFEVQSEEKVH
jgi:hypothetical protein